ncbi:Purine ribonucleoside efflux pump nepI [Kluyvera cryocrescens]|uniref:Purine ribonucleoside efflux pump nepI n=1 Tax=Kluyvera cryocrescens TaxID=580 RepID=A0A485D1X2_KLUCR|nr:Purine ribonucleoside efflux pump nepI [Kluyvera cryocrescens]
MTLCVFVLIASEFMPVSLLTPIAGDLHVTQGRAGQGIAISGALAVLTSVTISGITGRVESQTSSTRSDVPDGPVRADYRSRTQLFRLYGRPGADWRCHWRVLVNVGGNRDSTGTTAAGTPRAGDF